MGQNVLEKVIAPAMIDLAKINIALGVTGISYGYAVVLTQGRTWVSLSNITASKFPQL